jgi:hypothetical protein
MRKLFAAFAALTLYAGAASAAGPTIQFPNSPWKGSAPARIQCGWLQSANMNSTADQAIPISVPSSTYMLDSIVISNASVSLSTAAGGFYTAASKGGTTLVANTQAYSTLTAAAVNAAGSSMSATLGTGATTSALNASPIYFSLTTGQGAAATADIRVYCRPLYPTR